MNASIFKKTSGSHLFYLESAYQELINAYLKLQKNNYCASEKDENTIRNDLVRIAEKSSINLNFRWITELPKLENNSRIDICIFTPLSHTNKSSDIEIECKIIGSDKYIDTEKTFSRDKSPTNGIMSFINGKYASKSSIGGMIGFNKEGSFEKKFANMYERITKFHSVNTLNNFEQYKIDKNFNNSYFTTHLRPTINSKISIYHLFFDFT